MLRRALAHPMETPAPSKPLPAPRKPLSAPPPPSPQRCTGSCGGRCPAPQCSSGGHLLPARWRRRRPAEGVGSGQRGECGDAHQERTALHRHRGRCALTLSNKTDKQNGDEQNGDGHGRFEPCSPSVWHAPPPGQRPLRRRPGRKPCPQQSAAGETRGHRDTKGGQTREDIGKAGKGSTCALVGTCPPQAELTMGCRYCLRASELQHTALGSPAPLRR
jgi:hypothetical protein